jgi:hypothetical protein
MLRISSSDIATAETRSRSVSPTTIPPVTKNATATLMHVMAWNATNNCPVIAETFTTF